MTTTELLTIQKLTETCNLIIFEGELAINMCNGIITQCEKMLKYIEQLKEEDNGTQH